MGNPSRMGKLVKLVGPVSMFTARVRSTRKGTVFTGVCLSTLAGDTPFPGLDGGGGGTHPRSGQEGYPGYPPIGVRTGGYPRYTPACPTLDGGTPSVQVWMGLPPPTGQETEQHSKHLLRGGRYTSCIHAGGLSCFNSFWSRHPHACRVN